MKYLLPLPVVALFVAAGPESRPADSFQFKTPSGVTYTVTAEGLSEVRLGKRLLARGGWRFRVGNRIWGLPAGPDEEAIASRAIEIVSPTEARVTHRHADVLARYTFAFRGEDVRIDSWVENHHPTAAIPVAAFEGPKVFFGRTPHGILPNWHPTYTAAGGVPCMHPGGIRIGGSYGVGDGFGVGAAPHDAGVHPTALLWDWNWSPGKREADPERTPKLYVHAPIPAGGARTFAVTFRFSPDTDWKHLLYPYRRHLYAVVGDRLLYKPGNDLPYAAGFACGNESHRSATNPHAFDPNHRLDSVSGVMTYHAAVAPTMRAISAQGIIVWCQGGLNPRGAMYRPDFDAMPPDISDNVARLAGLFREQGFRFGVATRPGQMVTPLDWKTDTVCRINPAEQDQLELLTRRFNTMIAAGSSLFYLDSFGNRIEDVAIMRAVRNGVGKQPGIGPDVRTFVEHPSDVIIPFSGLLPVLVRNGAEGKLTLAFEGAFWVHPPETPDMPEVMRYFYPDVSIACLIAVQGANTEARQRPVV
ncbi:MAG TPA: hypothetical protein VH120_06940, partial [Gemmataceae bacterium]|nr:hypothetical protein [Gemmataceae bacterium]